MLIINLCSVGMTFLMCLFCAYVLNDLDLLLYSVVVMCAIHSMVSESVVTRIVNVSLVRDFTMEIVLTIIFIVSAKCLSLLTGAAVYFVALLLYLFIKYAMMYTLKK